MPCASCSTRWRQTARRCLQHRRSDAGASDGGAVHNAERAFTARHIAPALRYDLLPDPAGVPRQDFPRRSAPRRTRRRSAAASAARSAAWRRCFAARTALPPAERLDRELAFLKHRDRRRLDPVLRSQFLRSRSGDGAAARGAGAPRAAMVVLCARRRAGEPLGRLLEAGAQEPAAHGIHRRRDAQRQTTANRSARARAPTRRSKSPSCAAAMA